MLPLCASLGITVNDLLSGERVSGTNYQKKAEENMMDLMKENEENRRWMILSVICAVITVIAVCALVVIASCLEMPAAARVALLVFRRRGRGHRRRRGRRAGREGRVLPMPKLPRGLCPHHGAVRKGSAHPHPPPSDLPQLRQNSHVPPPRCPVRAVLTFADVPPIIGLAQSAKRKDISHERKQKTPERGPQGHPA